VDLRENKLVDSSISGVDEENLTGPKFITLGIRALGIGLRAIIKKGRKRISTIEQALIMA